MPEPMISAEDFKTYIVTLSDDERNKIERLAPPETDNNSKLMEGLRIVLHVHKERERPTDAPSLVVAQHNLVAALDWIKDKTYADILSLFIDQ
jgi:hypothetical protein